MSRYESDTTLFIKELKKSHPNLEKNQRDGRQRLWDKPQDTQLQQEFKSVELSSKRSGY